MPDADVPPNLWDYVYRSPRPGTSLLVFGHGWLYNHGVESNIGWRGARDESELLRTGQSTMEYWARRDIREGEELLANYGEAYWNFRGVEPW